LALIQLFLASAAPVPLELPALFPLPAVVFPGGIHQVGEQG